MSVDTRRYCFGVIVEEFAKLLDAEFKKMGYEEPIQKDDAHAWIKQRFGIKSTKQFKHENWEALIIGCQAYAANIFHHYIKDPNE